MQWGSKFGPGIALCAALVSMPAAAVDGAVDSSFGDAGIAYVAPDQIEAISFKPSAAIALPDGKLLFAGSRYKQSDNPFEPEIRAMFARLNADGSADASFGNIEIPGVLVLPSLVSGQRMQEIHAIQRLADGSVVIAGDAYGAFTPRGFVAKIDAAGELDPNFGDSGVAAMPDRLRLSALGVDSQGRLLACGDAVEGTLTVSVVVRLLPNGDFDSSFGEAGITHIPWSGGENLWGELDALAVTAGDGVVVGGNYEIPGKWGHYGHDYAIARLDKVGRLDPAFAGVGWRVFHDPTDASTSNAVQQLALLPDRRVVFAGYHISGENQSSLVLGALLPDGSTDASFGDLATPGYFKPQPAPDAQTMNPTALVVQPDGKLIVGATYYVEGDHKQLFYALRATDSGRLDAGFADHGVILADVAPGGVNSELSAIALQTDGRIVLAGRSLRTADWSIGDLAAMRLLNTLEPTDRVFADGFDAD